MDGKATAATLKRLHAALEEDHMELARRYAMVKARITKAAIERELLIDELCRYPASDFDSDSDDDDQEDTAATSSGTTDVASGVKADIKVEVKVEVKSEAIQE
ncbi:hypothetical protein ACHHYP_01726 [Achlya hypogyna]|uniref:Uncharacterized protein n=1 Tax=Achlya hypogyna TaxID=1202772 RepID=A0A1V9ZT36_ACHHY|nr:hypothetical protein ACHHYP_01726 [Achlya hypogyna]